MRFLATEFSTGKSHGGRIDTLGIDENGCPVIIEYKRSVNQNVINQGLFYLDWLLDHRGEFSLLVMDTLGAEAMGAIEFSSPRLLCIAGDFTRYDEHAIQQINRTIELIRYRRYGTELLLLELVNATIGDTQQADEEKPAGRTATARRDNPMFSELLEKASPQLRDRFEALDAFLVALGDDVQPKTLKFYAAYKRIKNFACVEVHPQTERVVLYVKVSPESAELVADFTRDVRDIGHYGTGDLEITVASDEDLERAKPLLLRSYEAS